MRGINVVAPELRKKHLGVNLVLRAPQRNNVDLCLPVALGFQLILIRYELDEFTLPAALAGEKRRKFRKNTFHDARGAERQKLYLRTKNSIVRTLAVLFLMLALSSCFDQGDCLITNSNLVQVSVRDFKTRAAVNVTFETVAIQGGDTLYTNKTVAALSLPVNPGLNETSFVFVHAGKTDTLSLGYSNETVVLAPVCGAFPFQKNLATTYSTFGQDSVEVTDRSLTKNAAENVRIYF